MQSSTLSPVSLSSQDTLLDSDDYEAARQCRDPRFDGRFFVGVLTTGIYCRPVCPVRIPKRENVQLYPSAAAAAEAGFRPCLRCRPESSPGTPAWSGAAWKVSRALQLIDQGALDEEGVDELAAQLSIGPRQLHRLFQQHLGASPVTVAQTRRLHFAKQLLDETSLPLTEVCFAAGFGSVRRFNAVFQDTYGRSPRQLRESRRGVRTASAQGGVRLNLSYRPPFDWRAMLAYLDYRAIPGVEVIAGNSYARSFRLDDTVGDFRITFASDSNRVELLINTEHTRLLQQIVDRVRSLFDLRADSAAIETSLAADPLLRRVLERYPGTRVPGCWNGLEVALRAVLGQQVSVKAASTLAARVVHRVGQPYASQVEGLTHVFPGAGELATANLDGLGIVGQRIGAIKAIAAAVARGELTIDKRSETNGFIEQICQIKGIGEWTAQYIAMRALNDPDACPHADLILRRAAAEPGVTLTPGQMRERAEAWRPWRAYAVLLLWRDYAGRQAPILDKQADKRARS